MSGQATIRLIASLAVLVFGNVLSAGPLNPPGGPVTSTTKSLGEVEPRVAVSQSNTPGNATSLYRITQPGSYYLTGNITGISGKHGIEIVASGVNLDLNGFELAGVASPNICDGVRTGVNGLSNIAVVNGTIRNWGNGIRLDNFPVQGCRIEDIRASNTVFNVGAGISAIISRVSTLGGEYGIYAQDGSTISDCSARNASEIGIATLSSGNVTRCSAHSCQFGITVGNASTVAHCSANSNVLQGIYTGFGCTISNCSAYSNDLEGILTGPACIIQSCTAALNGTHGIQTSDGCITTNCSAAVNEESGIVVATGCSVIECNTRANEFNGIQCIDKCVIRGNTASDEGLFLGGAGISVNGSANRIEGNNSAGSFCGIEVTATGNIIIKNTCRGNSINWDVIAGNVILVVPAAYSGAGVFGNSGGNAPGSVDPNANFSY